MHQTMLWLTANVDVLQFYVTIVMNRATSLSPAQERMSAQEKA